jgi:hypothetical protein
LVQCEKKVSHEVTKPQKNPLLPVPLWLCAFVLNQSFCSVILKTEVEAPLALTDRLEPRLYGITRRVFSRCLNSKGFWFQLRFSGLHEVTKPQKNPLLPVPLWLCVFV